MMPPEQLGPFLNGQQDFLQNDLTKMDKRFLAGVQTMLSSWQQVITQLSLLIGGPSSSDALPVHAELPSCGGGKADRHHAGAACLAFPGF